MEYLIGGILLWLLILAWFWGAVRNAPLDTELWPEKHGNPWEHE